VHLRGRQARWRWHDGTEPIAAETAET
jgi:hypothetical protein